MTNYAINLIWFTYDAANHTQKKKLAKQRETASVEKIYCCRHLLFMGHTQKKIQNSLLRKANAYHPTHIKSSGEISEIETQQCTLTLTLFDLPQNTNNDKTRQLHKSK